MRIFAAWLFSVLLCVVLTAVIRVAVAPHPDAITFRFLVALPLVIGTMIAPAVYDVLFRRQHP